MRGFLALLAGLLFASSAFAQSNPGWVFGQVPTATQWNNEWSSKLDYNAGGTPISAGGTGATTVSGALTNLGLAPLGTSGATIPLLSTTNSWGLGQIFAPGSTSTFTFRCPAGTVESSPTQGDVYCDSAGMYGYFGGSWHTFSFGAASSATPATTSALASNLVVKGASGTLYDFEVTADSTLDAAPWYIMVFNTTSAPADGAVTPAKCYQVASGQSSAGGSFGTGGINFSTGITLVVSTTGCFTKTASAHALISGDYQ